MRSVPHAPMTPTPPLGRPSAVSPAAGSHLATMDQTILPSDLRREGLAGGLPQSARAGGDRSGTSTPVVGTPIPRLNSVRHNTSDLGGRRGGDGVGGFGSRTSSRPVSANGGAGIERGSAASEEKLLARRYEAKQDFKFACGDGNGDLASLPPEASIFFFVELASLHAAVREDEFAAQLLWRARGPTERLPSNHPDAAAVWCSLGRMAYLGGAFDAAARCTEKGRWIRERTLGGDTVETATSYNNLACCLFALCRPLEALAYLELAEELLRVLAGEEHPRTQTALRNLEQARSAHKHIRCEVPHLFSYYVKAMRVRGGRRKKKKSKKGSGNGSRSGASSSRRSSSRGSASSKSKKSSAGGRRRSAR